MSRHKRSRSSKPELESPFSQSYTLLNPLPRQQLPFTESCTMSSIYNHRNLQPAPVLLQNSQHQQPPPNALPQPTNMIQGGTNPRLQELLDIVKKEFEAVAQDSVIYKAQRDEYEKAVQNQISESALMRQQLFELEGQHKKMTQEYEAEIQRLRHELDTRSQPAGSYQAPPPPASQVPVLPMPRPPIPGGQAFMGGPPPTLDGKKDGQEAGLGGRPYRAPSPSPTLPAPTPGSGKPSPHLPTSQTPSQESQALRAPSAHPQHPLHPGSTPGGGPIQLAPTPQIATPGSTHASLHHQPQPQQPLPLNIPATLPGVPTHGQKVGTPSGSSIGAPPTPPPPAQSPSQGQTIISDLDPDSLPNELKKEGSDWIAVWSPKVKKTLDIGLVHTLVHESVVCCVKFSADGRSLATGCNRSCQIYDAKTGARECILVDESLAPGGDLYIRSICFSPDGKYLATGAEDRQIRIWDIKAKKIRHLLQGHVQEIYSLDFSRDGRYIVSGSGDKTAKVWDIETGRCVVDLKVDDFVMTAEGPVDAGITSVAVSPDGKFIAAGSLDTIIRIWDLNTGKQLERLRGHKDSVYSVAFAPDGSFIASGSLDRTIRIWDISSTRHALEQNAAGVHAEYGHAFCHSTLAGHKDYVLSVSASHDGKWVVSGSKDRSVQFFDVATGQAQLMLQGHKNSVISIDLSKTSGMLATGSGDYCARIWSYGPV